MRLYEPKVEVRLVKNYKRQEIVPGVPVASRYQKVESIDLTPFLCEQGGVHVAKSVREPAGAFSVSLADREVVSRDGVSLDTLYALIEPMDMVEIRMAHDPFNAASFDESDQEPQETVADKRKRLQSEFNMVKAQWSAALKPATELTTAASSEPDPTKKRQMLAESESIRKEAAAKYEAKYDELKAELDALNGASDPPRKKTTGRLPVVMRGLVSSITRSESLNGTRPSRMVTIAGQDFGKILQIIQIFYLNNSVVGDNILSEFAFFHKYGEQGQAKIKAADDFVLDVLNNVINPYLKRFSALANGEKVGAKVINSWAPNVSIDGAVSPYSVATFNNVSLYQMLCSLLDVGAFNELFVEDLESGVALTVRPAPFLNSKMEPIQGVMPSVVTIRDTDIIGASLTRTDAGVANYFWVSNSRWSMMNNEGAKRLASVGDAGSFIMFDYQNSDAAVFGVRKMEVETVLGPVDYSSAESATKEQLPVETQRLLSWFEQRRSVLAQINKDNVIFESGSLRVRGNERIKAGMQLNVIRGNGVHSTYYVTRVEHQFVPMAGFYTMVTVERGTNFIGRSQADAAQYRAEINGWGVS